MRRLAIILLTCLGLTLTLSGVAVAAKPQPLTPVQLTDVTASPVVGLPELCLVQVQFSQAPAAPKNTEFLYYAISLSTDPNAPWGELTAQTTQSSPFTLLDPLRNDGTTWYFNVTAYYLKLKGKGGVVLTPFDPPASLVVSC